MAVCKICGAENKGLPLNWDNWECRLCVRDEYRTYCDGDGDSYLEEELNLFSDDDDSCWPSAAALTGKIRFGKPALIAICKISRCCPLCEAKHPTYNYDRLVSGIDFALDKDGNITGALCATCNFAF